MDNNKSVACAIPWRISFTGYQWWSHQGHVLGLWDPRRHI